MAWGRDCDDVKDLPSQDTESSELAVVMEPEKGDVMQQLDWLRC